MKKGTVIFVILLVLIFSGLGIVVAVAVSGSPEHFVSPMGEREWARKDYESLFITPTEPLPVLSSEPLVVRKMTEKKDRVEFTFPKIEEDSLKLTRFGTRIDAATGQTEVKLADGNTVQLLGLATYFPEKLHKPYQHGLVDLVWHDPVTIEPLDKAAVANLKLKSETRIDLSERTLILAFAVSNPELPHSWQSVNIRNADTLCRINSSSRSQTRENVHYHSVELDIYSQAELMVLLSVGHGNPETRTINPATMPADEPMVFDSGNVQITVPFTRNASQNSLSHSGDGSDSVVGFGWLEEASSYQQSFAIIEFQPAVHGNQFEWRTTDLENKNKNYWRKIYQNEGLTALGFEKKLAGTGPIEIRHFPTISHVAFNLSSIPGLTELENLFEVNSGPVRFRHDAEVGRFLSRATQTINQWSGSVWPDSAYPLELDNVTPGEVIARIESLNGIQLHVDPETYEIDQWEPKPLLELVSDWFEELF